MALKDQNPNLNRLLAGVLTSTLAAGTAQANIPPQSKEALNPTLDSITALLAQPPQQDITSFLQEALNAHSPSADTEAKEAPKADMTVGQLLRDPKSNFFLDRNGQTNTLTIQVSQTLENGTNVYVDKELSQREAAMMNTGLKEGGNARDSVKAMFKIDSNRGNTPPTHIEKLETQQFINTLDRAYEFDVIASQRAEQEAQEQAIKEQRAQERKALELRSDILKPDTTVTATHNTEENILRIEITAKGKEPHVTEISDKDHEFLQEALDNKLKEHGGLRASIAQTTHDSLPKDIQELSRQEEAQVQDVINQAKHEQQVTESAERAMLTTGMQVIAEYDTQHNVIRIEANWHDEELGGKQQQAQEFPAERHKEIRQVLEEAGTVRKLSIGDKMDAAPEAVKQLDKQETAELINALDQAEQVHSPKQEAPSSTIENKAPPAIDSKPNSQPHSKAPSAQEVAAQWKQSAKTTKTNLGKQDTENPLPEPTPQPTSSDKTMFAQQGDKQGPSVSEAKKTGPERFINNNTPTPGQGRG